MTKALLVAFMLSVSAPVLAAEEVNACGCYRDDSGNCKCVKKGKCACPGDCEPVGCEEKRQKQAEKQAEADLKRIAAKEKKKAAEAKKEGAKKKKEAK